jgi:Beta-lactamase enzyme family
LATRQGDVTAAVEDLTNGQVWTLNPGVPEATASIVKVDIMAALFAQETKGTPLTASEQAELAPMIEESDNDSATALWMAAGQAPGIAAFNSTIGLTDTTPSPCLTCAGFSWPGWGLTTTTATDQITLLDHLVSPNNEIGSSERSEALSLMENVDSDEAWGVSTGVPRGVTVALKNGWVPLQNGLWQINSIGWVDGAGQNYLVAVLDGGNPTEGYGIDTVDQVSEMVWNAFSSGQ